VFASASLYGLRIQANTALPGLTGATAESSPDIWLNLRATPDWLEALDGTQAKTTFASPDLNEDGQPLFSVAELQCGDYFRLSYCDGVKFFVDRAGIRIWVEWPDTLSLEDISTYLFGPVIGWVLRLRGALCLHASAVAVNGGAIAFVGESGAGKSTTAAGFSQRGHAVLADDVVAIFGPPGSLLVRPSYPELRLWPESVTALSGSDNGRSKPLSTTEKFRLDLRQRGQRFQDEPLPLAAVYILNNEDVTGRNDVRALTHREAMMTLVANTHAGRLLGPPARKQEFELLAALVARVRVCEVSRGTDLAQLPRLCDAILSDLENQSACASFIEAAGA